ncbi:MAG TPA: peptide-methionine (R)-S-oxide reductase MsrB [Candidatus Saccharimonadales bacterium]
MIKSDEEWRQQLTPEQYHILREKGTEMPGSGALLHNDKTGEYACVACGNVLFDSSAKFKNNGINGGWPSFNQAIPGSVKLVPDESHGMHRTEVICSNCGGHLGHVFEEASQSTGQDYCINSAALTFNSKQ